MQIRDIKDARGQAIPRPRRFKGKPLPRGDCGGKLIWLRTVLMCTANACMAQHQGDRC